MASGPFCVPWGPPVIDGGYIRLYRKLLDHPIWTRLTPPVLKVAIYFLIKANWRATDWYDGRKRVPIARGTFVTSYASAATECRLTLKQVRLAFGHLSKLGFASYARDGSWTMVVLPNYDEYESEKEPNSEARLTIVGEALSRRCEGTDSDRHEGTAKDNVTTIIA